jgi:hypothetical protein
MVRRLIAVAAGVGVMLVGTLGQAQTSGGSFGSQGQFIISADRLFPVLGYSRASSTEPQTPPAGVTKVTDTEDSSSLGFFWGGTPAFTGVVGIAGANVASIPVTNFYTVPRLGFDYAILPNVTVGGDLILFFTLGGSTSHEVYNNGGGTQTTTTNEPTNTTFGIAPRGGYIMHLSDLFSVWLRGGFSFYTLTWKESSTVANTTTTFSANYNQFALDLDPQLVITPFPHFGFTVGLTGDIPLAGGHSFTANTGGTTSSVSAGSSLMFVGLTSGLVGWF